MIHQKFHYIRNSDMSQCKYIRHAIPQNSNPVAIHQEGQYTANSNMSVISIYVIINVVLELHYININVTQPENLTSC